MERTQTTDSFYLGLLATKWYIPLLPFRERQITWAKRDEILKTTHLHCHPRLAPRSIRQSLKRSGLSYWIYSELESLSLCLNSSICLFLEKALTTFLQENMQRKSSVISFSMLPGVHKEEVESESRQFNNQNPRTPLYWRETVLLLRCRLYLPRWG